jgi:hypothetical protein
LVEVPEVVQQIIPQVVEEGVVLEVIELQH